MTLRRVWVSLSIVPIAAALALLGTKCTHPEDGAPTDAPVADAELPDGGDAAAFDVDAHTPETADAVPTVPAPPTTASAQPDPTASIVIAVVPELPTGPGDEEPLAEPAVVIEARVDRGWRTWVLALVEQTAGSSAIETEPSAEPPTFVARLIELERRVDGAGVERFERLRSLELSRDVLRPIDVESDCGVPSELRARDVDGDGEIEIVAMFGSVLRDYSVEFDERECVTHAIVLGADDLAPQLTIERERVYHRLDAWTETDSRTERVFVFRDLDGDGHADVRLTEIRSERLYESADDCEEDGPGSPARHSNDTTRASWDCPWDPVRDVWACPADARLAEDARAR